MNTQKLIRYFSFLVLILLGLALSFKQLREPDLWWQLLTGDYILSNFSIPQSDIFSFTHEGVPWINVKWLFEVLQAIFYKLGGAELLYLMQALVNLSLIWITWKLSRLLFRGSTSLLPLTVSIIIVFLGMNFRMNGRPEMISHLLTGLFLLLYLIHLKRPSWHIYLLIPLQILWTNLHEAYGTGMVILLAILGSEILRSFILNIKTKPDKSFLLASLIALLGVSVNPRGIYMLIHPLEIFGQVGQNKFTTELYSFQTDYYWQQEEPYIAIAVLVISLLSIFLGKKSKGGFVKRLDNQLGIAYWIMFAAFSYLGLTAHRNLPFFFVWSIPALLISLNFISEKLSRFKIQDIAAIGLSMVLYIAVVSNYIYEKFDSDYRYGLKVSAIDNPIGAANFIRDNQLSGPCFSDYLVSSYLLWDLRPDFKSFIDFRDLDIFPAEFFQAFNQMAAYPADFDKFHSKYDFGYAVLNRVQFPALHQYLLNKPNWELSYADPVAVVYVNRAKNDLEYSSRGLFEREDIFTTLPELESSGIASALSTLVNPFFSIDNPKVNLDYQACLYFESVGRHDLSIKRSEAALQNRPNDLKAILSAGNAYLLLSNMQQDVDKQTKLLQSAYQYFTRGYQLDRENIDFLQGIAQVQMSLGKPFDAMGSLKTAAKIEERSQVFALMAQCQNLLMQADPKNQGLYTNKWYEYMIRAHELKPDDPILNYNLGVSYCQSGDCVNAKPYLEKASFTPELSQNEMQTLSNCKKQCGVSESMVR